MDNKNINNICVYCKEPVEDFEPIFCCNGYMCGCEGDPIDPPIHKICSFIMLLEHIKKEKNKLDFELRCKKSGGVEILSGSKVISNDNITAEEAFTFIGLLGNIKCLSSKADYIIEKLKTIEK